MFHLDGGMAASIAGVFWKAAKTHPRMSRAVPSGRREGMFPDRYSQIFGRGERLGYVF